MRRLVLLCCTCLACTPVNTAFDGTIADGESGTDARGDTSTGPTGAERISTCENDELQLSWAVVAQL